LAASSSGLYFLLTSKSGIWSVEDINSCQREAGLKVKKPITLMRLPGWQMLIATSSGEEALPLTKFEKYSLGEVRKNI
jgi:hypothetical protein